MCEDSADNKQGGILVPLSEQQARGNIDVLLEAAGWHVCDAAAANIHAARGVAIREFPLPGYGFADYLLYVDGKAAGVIEAKKEGVTLPMTSFHC
jgi:type I restriction enzyme R subunit